MTDAEIDLIVYEIDRMAQSIGCRFVPDPERLLAFRCAKKEQRSMSEYYRRERDLVNK